MQNCKWLSESVHTECIEKGVINIVHAPTGSGKTTWSINELSQTVSHPTKMIYLIDTKAGRQQLEKNERIQGYTDQWRETVQNGIVWFGEAYSNDKIVCITYAKFGAIISKYPDFGKEFELIVCDELHSLPRFCQYGDNKDGKNFHEIALKQLEAIANIGDTTVIALSATPDRAEQMNCDFNYVPVDNEVRQYKTKNRIDYSNLSELIKTLPPDKTGILYTLRITDMLKYCDEARSLGINAIAIWSIGNTDHPMTDEQHKVRQYIIDNAALPLDYKLFIINASYETSININSHVDYIIVHHQNEDTQIQVRGRYRDDLDTLYVLNYDINMVVPKEYIGVRLFKEDKDKLCEIMKPRNKQGNLVGWPTLHDRLIAAGYYIIDDRHRNRRFSVITD